MLQAIKYPMKSKTFFFKLLPIILFFFLICPGFVQESMYNDGIWYAILSSNLANGAGNFWAPKLTETIFPVFREHPPLVFGIQSLFFQILGNSIIVERIYAFIIFILSSFLIIQIWKYVFRDQENMQGMWFLPLILWILNEVTWLYYPANVLEPTLGVFTLGSIYCFIQTTDKNLTVSKIMLITFGSILILGAMLCKGFVGLFPVVFFGIHWLIFRNFSFLELIKRMAVIISVVALGFFIFFLFKTSREALLQYFDSQVLASISGERTLNHYRSNHMHIIGRLFEILLPAIAVSALFFAVTFRKKTAGLIKRDLVNRSLLFIFIGISASFPLAISLKQAYYYLLPSLPYFSIGLGIIISPLVDDLIQRNRNINKKWAYKGGVVGLLIISITFSLAHLGTISKRDKILLEDVYKITSVVPDQSTVDLIKYDPYFVGYLYRLNYISIDTSNAINHTFLIIPNDFDFLELSNYEKVDIPTDMYDLYQHVNN